MFSCSCFRRKHRQRRMEGTEIGSGGPTGIIINPNIPQSSMVGSFGGEMNSEDNEWFDRPDHPLMNNMILNKVFKHLRERDLLECRIVCKTWNVSTIPYTRKTVQVTIYKNQDLMKGYITCSGKFVRTIYMNPYTAEEKLHTIENFVKLFGSNKLGIPFGKFKQESFCTTDGDGQKFLRLCGNTTLDIQFLEDKFRVEDVSEILKSTLKLEKIQIPKYLHSSSGNIVKLFPEDSKPKLMSLKHFTAFYDDPMERNKVCPTFLEELITAAENISCVSLTDDLPTNDENQIFSSYEVLSLIEKLGRESSLQQIQISHKKNDHSDYVELLGKMAAKRNGLKLKKLQIDTDYSGQEFEDILQIISLFKDTLEFLSTFGKCFSFMEFPEMTRLTHMHMSICKDFNFRFTNLSKIFPVLESLRLSPSKIGEGDYDEFFPESDPYPTVTSLQLYWFSLKLNGFNQVLTVFPNVTDFRVEIKEDGEEILRQIWTQMIQLESLDIFGSIQTKDSMDCVLTGISDQVLGEIRDVVNNLEKMTEIKRRETICDLRNEHSHLPSIRSLTKLRSLTLDLTVDGEVRCERKFLTDFTGYLGFYSIKTLKKLDVEQCGLTKNCCEILRKDLMGLDGT